MLPERQETNEWSPMPTSGYCLEFRGPDGGQEGQAKPSRLTWLSRQTVASWEDKEASKHLGPKKEGRKAHRQSTSENSLGASPQVPGCLCKHKLAQPLWKMDWWFLKHIPNATANHSSSKYLTNGKESICSHRNMHMHV